MRAFRAWVLAALAVPLWSAPSVIARVETGFTTERFDDLGLSLLVPRSYESVALPPGERWAVLAYAEKARKDGKFTKSIRPRMSVVWIDSAPKTPLPATAEKAPTEVDPRRKRESRIGDLATYMAAKYPGWKLGRTVEAKGQSDYVAREAMISRPDDDDRPITGWVYAYEGPARSVIVLGQCGEYDVKEHVALWRACAERLRLFEPSDKSGAALLALYANSKFVDIPRRVAVRKRLVRGWRAEDTEHFIVVYDTKDQPLIRKICFDVEVLYALYASYFPPAGAMSSVSTVRVCRDRDEYLAYGGDEGTAGYFNFLDEELVFYDAHVDRKNGIADDTLTLVVLYHEAFHQFIHYSVGELPPHPWFNEGHGDFFGGARVHGELQSIGPNPMRVDDVQKAVQFGRNVPWKDIVTFEQSRFMQDAGIHYPQSWSMIYFLRTSPEVQKRAEWRNILPSYFDELKKAWSEEKVALELAGDQNDWEKRWKAGKRARSRALSVAFTGVDYDEIDSAWIAFVKALPGTRAK